MLEVEALLDLDVLLDLLVLVETVLSSLSLSATLSGQ
jgi:hypothetical protein